MYHIVFVCILGITFDAISSLSTACVGCPQALGWQLSAIGHLSNVVLFSTGSLFWHQKTVPYILFHTCALCICVAFFFLMYYGVSYTGQIICQNLLMAMTAFYAFTFYLKIPKPRYYPKLIIAGIAANAFVSWMINNAFIIFIGIHPHNEPLRPISERFFSFSYSWIVFGIFIIVSLSSYYRAIKTAQFDPTQSYIIHFLPMGDGIRTWFAFLFAMIPIPHYAIYYDGNLWKGSQHPDRKKKVFTCYPSAEKIVQRLLKSGLILILEPVAIIHRLEDLEEMPDYHMLFNNCHHGAKYVKGNTKWLKGNVTNAES